MTGNRFEDNWGAAAYGLLLKEISDARLERQRLRAEHDGLIADGAKRIVAAQRVRRQRVGASELDASTVDGRFDAKRLRRRTRSTSRPTAATPTTTFAGNYWDAYRGYDLDHDGTRRRAPPAGAPLLAHRRAAPSRADSPAERLRRLCSTPPSACCRRSRPDALADAAYRCHDGRPADDRISRTSRSASARSTCCAASISPSTAAACSRRRPERRRQDDAHQVLLAARPSRRRATSASTACRSPTATRIAPRIGYMPQIARFPENLTGDRAVRDARAICAADVGDAIDDGADRSGSSSTSTSTSRCARCPAGRDRR